MKWLCEALSKMGRRKTELDYSNSELPMDKQPRDEWLLSLGKTELRNELIFPYYEAKNNGLGRELGKEVEELLNREVKPSEWFNLYVDSEEMAKALGRRKIRALKLSQYDIDKMAEHTAAYRMNYDVVVARTQGGEVIGACVTQLIQERSPLSIDLNFVAVAKEWRGRGLARYLIGAQIAQYLYEKQEVKLVYGNCRPESTDFYRKLGFQVTEPGGAVPSHLIATGDRSSQQPEFPVMFWRELDG